MRKQAGTALSRDRRAIVTARESHDAGPPRVGLCQPERKLVGLRPGGEKDRFPELARRHLGQLMAGFEHRWGEELRAGVQQSLDLPANLVDELWVVMSQDAADHPRSQVQEFITIGILQRAAAGF